MRISDWSSDVCSSDLYALHLNNSARAIPNGNEAWNWHHETKQTDLAGLTGRSRLQNHYLAQMRADESDQNRAGGGGVSHHRSEERRVGKERVSTCRSRRRKAN